MRKYWVIVKTSFQPLPWADFFAPLVTWAVVFFTLVQVVPVFEDIFNEFGAILPLPLKFVIHTSHFVQSWWPAVALVGISALAGFTIWRKRKKVARDGQPSLILDQVIPVGIIALGIFTFIFIIIALYMAQFRPGDTING